MSDACLQRADEACGHHWRVYGYFAAIEVRVGWLQLAPLSSRSRAGGFVVLPSRDGSGDWTHYSVTALLPLCFVRPLTSSASDTVFCSFTILTSLVIVSKIVHIECIESTCRVVKLSAGGGEDIGKRGG